MGILITKMPLILIVYDLSCNYLYDPNKYQFRIKDFETDFFGEEAGLELFE